MKHLLKIVIVLLCVITFPAYSQNPNYEVITSECISAYGSSSASLSGDVDSIIGWYGAGDIDVAQSQTASTSFTSTGPGKGCITVKFKAKGADSCSCASAASADVYKSFSLHDSIQIEGPTCVSPGQTVVYSIYPIVTKNINDRIGIDSYYWNIDTMVGKPNSFVESVHYTSGDSSSVTFTVKDWDDNIGPNEISVIVGQCNINNSGAKRTLNIMKQAPKPDFGFDHLCIPYGETPFTLTILNASSNVEYTWAKSPDWEFLEFNADSTSVTVRPNADSPDTISVSAVYKNNKGMECATTKNVLQIYRRWGEKVNVTGQKCVIADGSPYRYSLTGDIPRKTNVRWVFPNTWVVTSKETTNQYIDAYPTSNTSLSDTIYVYEMAQCDDPAYTVKHDSIIVYVKPAKVTISGEACVEANTSYTYTIERKQGAVGPMADNYEWRIYRKNGNSYVVPNQNGASASISFPADVDRLVVMPLGLNNSCNADTTQFAIMISPTPPSAITWENEHCIAAGMEDSVILSVTNAIATQPYTWDYITQTHNWSLKRYPTDNHSQIVLYTTGQAGLDSVAVFIKGICGETERKKIGFETNEVGFIIERDTVVSFFWLKYKPNAGVTFKDPILTWYENGHVIATGSVHYVNMTPPSNDITLVVTETDADSCKHSYTYHIGRGNNLIRRTNNLRNDIRGELKLIPNPANDFVKLVLPKTAEDTHIYVYSSSGQLVYTATSNEDVLSIPTLNLADGVYPIIVQQSDLKIGDVLIIKH